MNASATTDPSDTPATSGSIPGPLPGGFDLLAELPEGVRGQVVPILDFGSQYVQLIARRVREQGVYSVLVPPDVSVEVLREAGCVGVILSGGPSSVYEEDAPKPDARLFELGVPVLGICYGMQVGCELLGAEVRPASSHEYGRVNLKFTDTDDALLRGLPGSTTAWMSHGDQVNALPVEDFVALATTPTCPYAAVKHKTQPFYGVQFHPEVTHTPLGKDLLANFLFDVCGATGKWTMADFMASQIAAIREQVGDAHVILGLSGGVDSSVVAALLSKAIGQQLTCIFVDNGLLRNGERELVQRTFRGHFDLDLRVIDATDDFLGDLKGITDPQEKRTRIGHRFIDVFKKTADEIKSEIKNQTSEIDFLAQGTLYPDVIESGHGYAGHRRQHQAAPQRRRPARAVGV